MYFLFIVCIGEVISIYWFVFFIFKLIYGCVGDCKNKCLYLIESNSYENFFGCYFCFVFKWIDNGVKMILIYEC